MNAHPRMRPPSTRHLPTSLLLCALALGTPAAHDAAAQSPPLDLTRFTRKVLVEGLNEPMQLEFDRRGRVYWIERGGTMRRLDESTGKVDLLGKIPVALVGEAGLIGLLLDRNFETTHHLYAYYS
jgi:cytochrome c